MTQKQKTAQTQQPTHLRAFVLDKYTHNGEERTNWIPVGVAFPHKDGKGFNLKCKAMPVDGELVIREDSQEGGAE